MNYIGSRACKKNSIFKNIFCEYLIVLVLATFFSYFVAPSLWKRNVYMMHSLIELICIFIAASTFLVIWNTYQKPIIKNSLLGFGFLSVAIFDAFHSYYYVVVRLFDYSYPDLATRYWIMGRLAEVIILFIFSLGNTEFRLNKWIAFTIVVTSTLTLVFATLLYPGIMPVMLENNSPTTIKIALEYMVTVLAIFSLLNIKDKINDNNAVSYKYVFMVLLFIIPSEIFFTLYKSITNFYNILGHILKAVSYYYIYKAVFASSIDYPYKKLEEAYAELEKTNNGIEEISATMTETLDALPIGIVKYGYNSRIEYMNKRIEEIFACNRELLYGLTAEELKNMFSCEGANDKNIFRLTFGEKRKIRNMVRTYRSLKGDFIKLSVTTKRLRKGVIAYFSEVKKEQNIHDFNLQTQTILNALSNGVFLIDINKKIILINNTFRKVLEVERNELIGMPIEEFNKLVNYERSETFDPILKGETMDKPYEATITTLKGNKKELLVHVAPIENIDCEIIGAIAVCTDITEIKKNQHYMQQQEKLAMIGQMAAGIVHEIKNPLATIKGLSQLIMTKAEVEKVKEYSRVISSAIDDTTKVVNEFLNFAKPKPTLMVRTNLNRIVESMQLLTETQCYTRNIKVQFHYSACPMEVTADEFKIKQAILNITENAIAAMENIEMPELIIATYYNPDQKEGIIQITDNGAGMPPEVLKQLGTPFFTTKEKGTGLGLGICNQIMDEHNGRVEVESTEGKGTSFKIIFTQIEDMI